MSMPEFDLESVLGSGQPDELSEEANRVLGAVGGIHVPVKPIYGKGYYCKVCYDWWPEPNFGPCRMQPRSDP